MPEEVRTAAHTATPSRARRLLAAVLLCTGGAAGLSFLELPLPPRLGGPLQDSGHALAFAALAFCTLHALAPTVARRGSLYVLVGIALFALGAAVEGVQHLSGRGASPPDLLTNLVGIVAGSLLFAATAGAVRSEPDGARSPARGRVLLAALGALTLLASQHRPLTILAIEALAPRLPTLADFEQPGAETFVASQEVGLALEREPADWADNGTRVLRAIFPPGRWPGFRIVDPPDDWSGYERLAFTSANLAGEPLELRLRLDHEIDGLEHRPSIGIALEPGTNRVEVPLADFLEASDDGASSTLGRIRTLVLYLSGNDSERTLLFDDIALLGDVAVPEADAPARAGDVTIDPHRR